MDTFNYFGCASNLKQSLLEERIGGHHVLNATVGRLIDYGFYFNHRQSDGQAGANIVAKKGEQVFGVIYVIDEKHYETLFKTEPGYQLIHVEVEIDSDNTVVEAQTFVAEITTTEDLVPSDEYLQTIITGAREHQLCQEYIEHIISIAKLQQK